MSTETIWNEFSNRLENFIRSKVNDAEVVKDLLQEIFIKIHLNKNKVQDGSKLKSWLFQITRNTIIDYYRQRKIKTDDLIEALENPSEEEQVEDEFKLHNCLKPYINDLPRKYQNALVQTAFYNVSQKDYALAEDLSYSAAKSRVQRAREMVKQQIIDCCNPQTDTYGNVLSKDDCKDECGCED